MPRFFFNIDIIKFIYFKLICIRKIVYLDLDYLLANSNKGKEVLLNLEQINKNIELLKKKNYWVKKKN